MKIKLLYKEIDKVEVHESIHKQNLIKDLKMEWIIACMSNKDSYLYEVCKEVLTNPLSQREDIDWRNAVVKEAILYPQLFRDIYELATRTLEEIETYREFTAPKYNQILKNSKKIITETEMLEVFLKKLIQLRYFMENEAFQFKSRAVVAFQKDFLEWISESFIESLRNNLDELKLMKEGQEMTLTGHLFLGFKRADYILNSLEAKEARQAMEQKMKLWDKLFGEREKQCMSIHLGDVGIENNIGELIEANLEGIFKVLSQFNKKLIVFFKQVRYQFGFYSCCERLYSELVARSIKCCFPEFVEGQSKMSIEELVDVALVIKEKKNVVSNTLSVEDKSLWIITGANQGGKTTFLRSLGVSILMAQSGLFVGASAYKSKIFTGIFTHFPSAEDEKVHKGLLEVELSLLDQIIDAIKRDGILLMNESFATTTEKEGSLIADEVTRALRGSGITTVFVTHLFEYADALYREKSYDTIFYRAGRGEDGLRNYQIEEGRPVESGNGTDLQKIMV